MTEAAGGFSSSMVSQPIRSVRRSVLSTAAVDGPAEGDGLVEGDAEVRGFEEHLAGARLPPMRSESAVSVADATCDEALPAPRKCGMASNPPANCPGCY
jgi:hypothetical protein